MRGSFLYAVITGLVFLGMSGPASARDGQSDYYGALGAKSEGRGQDAFALYDRACSSGYLAGCMGAAGMLADGDGIAMDQARARQYFQTACNGQHKVACNWLGDMLLAGEGGTVDAAGARALYARGCSLGHAASCVEGGELIEFGFSEVHGFLRLTRVDDFVQKLLQPAAQHWVGEVSVGEAVVKHTRLVTA